MRLIRTLVLGSALMACRGGGTGAASGSASGSATGSGSGSATGSGSGSATVSPSGSGSASVPASGPPTLVVTATPPLAAGTPSALALEVDDSAGARVTAFDVVHEKLLHLIVVNADLSFFSHVHPELQPDGTFRLTDFVPPAPGSYFLYGDHRPTGGAPQVARATVRVPGDPPLPLEAAVDTLPITRTSGPFTVTLSSKAPLVAGTDAVLQYAISEGDKPVTDLRNYLGALGHCVGISRDNENYVHSHPLGASVDGRVDFHTIFPAPGSYRVWAEFRPRGEVLLINVDVTVVAAGAATPDAPAAHDHGPHAH